MTYKMGYLSARSLLFTAYCLLQYSAILAKETPTCTTFTLDGVTYDLSPLKQTSRPYEYVVKEPGGQVNVFYANICGGLGFVKSCPAAMEGSNANAVAARLTSTEGCTVLGELNPNLMHWKRVNMGEVLVVNAKTDGGGESTIQLVCDKATALAQSANLTRVEYNPNKAFAQFFFATGLVCGTPQSNSGGGDNSPAAKSGSSSSGIHTVVIVLLLGLLVYCVVGFAWNVRGGEPFGVEAIPNYAFWREVPVMVTERVSGIIHYLRDVIGGRSGGIDSTPRESSSTGRYSEI